MKIKRFLAPDMRTALQHVRQEHGPDAVILSNRVIPEGVEIVAASQYDEELVRSAADASSVSRPAAPADATVTDTTPSASTANDDTTITFEPALIAPNFLKPSLPAVDATLATPTWTSAPAGSSIPAARVDAAPVVEAISPSPAPVADVAPAATPTGPIPEPADTDALIPCLREEFAQMRQMIERGLNRMTDERLRSSPVRQYLLEWMEEHGFSSEIIREIALKIPADSVPKYIHAQALTLLSERLPIAQANLLDEGGVIALIGPSGSGKTSTVGKLTAHYSARHGVREIALISLDHARTGGSDRLYRLARQLGIAAHEADSSESLALLLQRLQDYRLVLIDCAGFAPHDPRAAEQLNWLRTVGKVRSLLVLPANTHHADLNDVVRRFQAAEPEGVIVTKLDETRRPGSVFSVLMQHPVPLTWVSDGQHLHDDLHRADADSLLQRLNAMTSAVDIPYDPVAALVANHAFS